MCDYYTIKHIVWYSAQKHTEFLLLNWNIELSELAESGILYTSIVLSVEIMSLIQTRQLFLGQDGCKEGMFNRHSSVWLSWKWTPYLWKIVFHLSDFYRYNKHIAPVPIDSCMFPVSSGIHSINSLAYTMTHFNKYGICP